MTVRVFVSFALFTLAAGGCLSPGKTDAYRAFGSNGSLAVGFAYDGKGVAPFDGPIYLDVDDAKNTGTLITKGKLGGTTWEVHVDQFAQQPGKTYEDGGIVANLKEHGNSGTGDRSIPLVDLEMGGWGFAKLTIGGKTVKDPVTGADTWAAHFMVIRNGVRDNSTGAIYADSAHTRPFDPAHAENGASVPGDYEIHLVLKNQTGPNPAETIPIERRASTAPSPSYSAQGVLFNARQLGGAATVNVNVTSTGLSATNLTFTIKGPGGATIATRNLGAAAVQPSTGPARAQIVFPVAELGDYSLAVTGRIGPGGGYDVSGLVVPPKTSVLYFWWEDLVFGSAAASKAQSAGLLPGAPGSATGNAHPTMSMSPSATANGHAP